MSRRSNAASFIDRRVVADKATHDRISFLFSPRSSFVFWDATFETGNYMELSRVDNFHMNAIPVS